MKTKTNLLLAICAACLLGLSAPHSSAQAVLDQQQPAYNGGVTGGVPFPYYGYWQSFTAGITGTLTRIETGFTGNIPNGQVYLKIWRGKPITGTLLATYTVPVVSVQLTGRNCTFSPWDIAVPVIAGQLYSFEFTAASSMPYPFGIALGPQYTGGNAGQTIFSLYSFDMPWDLVFRTWVEPTP